MNQTEHNWNQMARAHHNKTTAMQNTSILRRGQDVRYQSYAARSNAATIEMAVQQDGTSLRFANKKLRDNYDLVLCAVNNNGLALEFAGTKLKNNKSLCLEACHQHGCALEFVSSNLQHDSDIIRAALSNNMSALVFVPDEAYSINTSLLEDVVRQSVRRSWYGNIDETGGGRRTDNNDPDFSKFNSVDYCEYYADRVFGKEQGREECVAFRSND
jgi:hypothetical protein